MEKPLAPVREDMRRAFIPYLISNNHGQTREKRNLNKYIIYEYPHFTNYHVGAYRIRPENIRVDKLAHSGVCDTPLHGRFAEFII